jgi:hypothetical protein
MSSEPLENRSAAHAEKALCWLRHLSGERPHPVPAGNGLDAGEGLPGDRLHEEHVERISWLVAHTERRSAPPGPAAQGAARRGSPRRRRT